MTSRITAHRALAPGHLQPIVWAIGSLFASIACAEPAGGVVTSGAGRIVQNGGATTITQGSNRMAIDWTAFSIGAGESVRFMQPGPGAIALNRVTGRESSVILGELSANGRVFLLNPNGVLFGRGARVEVGSLVASTLTLSNADFAAGRFELSGDSTARVVNQGTIQAAPGGHLALIASGVENTGTLGAPGGSVLLAAASSVSLTMADGSPLGYTISTGAAQALADNGGLIVADGGRVTLTARGRDHLADAVVNSSGVVQARSVRNDRGTIELIGDPAAGIVRVDGRLDASAPDAGGVGGTVRVLGDKVGLFDGARVDASGTAGGGQVLVGGNFQGAGPAPNASAAFVAPTASVDASATLRGPGGEIIVWGTDAANVHGRLKAAGGPSGGSGGRIETSGHALDTSGIEVDVSGGGGLWLLDPYNVTISTGAQTGGGFSGGVWTPSASGSLVNTGSIQSILNGGGNVTIRTVGAGAQEGNIAINGSISKTAGGAATLSLVADGRITTNATSGGHRTISSSSGALNVSMSAAATTSASNTSAISLRFLDINANGGTITVTANGASSATLPALDLSNSVWTTSGAGAISLTGTTRANGNTQGVWLRSTSLSTATGPISVSGTSGGIATVTGTNANGAPLFSTNNIGVYLNGGNSLTSSGGGAITLTGTAAGNTATWSGSAVTLGALDTLSTTGAVTITGTATNPSASTYRNQQSTVALIGSSSNAVSVTGGSVTINGTNGTVGGASSTSNGNAAVKLDGKVNLTATSGALGISGSNAGGDGVWGTGSGAVRLSAPASSTISITANALDTVSGYTGFYIGGGGATLTVPTLAPLQINAESLASGRRSFWNKGGLIVPGNLSLVSAAGMVADDTTFGGYFQIGGSTSIQAGGAGNTVSLTNGGNAFSGPVAVTAASTMLFNTTALTLGPSAVTGTLTVTAPGLAQSGAVTVSGASVFNAGSSAITLTHAGNSFGGAVSLAGSSASLRAGAALTLGASTLTGNLTANAPGIAQSGALSIGGATSLNSGSSAITLTNSSNAFGGAVSLMSGNATINAGGPLNFGASTLSGSLSAAAGGLSQSGALSVAGTTTLNGGASAITLTNNSNAFGGAVSLTSSDASIGTSGPLIIGPSTLSGAFAATGAGISQSGALSVAGATTLNSGSSATTLANGSNVFGGAVSITGGDATIGTSGPLIIGPSTLSGAFAATGAGISQSGALSVAGATTLNSGSSAITLANSSNVFGGAMSLTSGDTTIGTSGPLIIGPSTVSGAFAATGAGISQSGALSVAGATVLNSGTSAITLADSGNAFGGAVSAAGRDATIVSSQPLSLGTALLSGDLSVKTPTLTQSGVISVAGTATLGGGSIQLQDARNAFTTLRVDDATNAVILNGQAMSVTRLSTAGPVSLTTTSGDLSVSGAWRLAGGDLTLSAGASRARGDATGGDVISSATLSLDPGRVLTVHSGSIDTTVLGGTLAQRAAAGSGNFRYGRQAGDPPGALGVGDGTTYVLYREQPTVTVTPIDAANTKVYDGGLTHSDIAWTVAGQRNGDTAAMIFSGALTRAAGEDAGRFAIQPGTLADRLGYAVALAPGHSYTITPAPLLVTVNDAARLIGQLNPAFQASYSGFVPGQSAASGSDLLGTLRFLTDATAASPAGRYDVFATGLSSRNYAIQYAPGVLTVLAGSPAGLATGSEELAIPYLASLAAIFRTASPDDAPPNRTDTRRWWTEAAAFGTAVWPADAER
ncbi:MBG domain-containing protein [Roseateles sp.]|uniref:beta strand repeat-containing protein n=1 Tax=Roseateles sp. TaxID=1971397 RepID=UPI0031D50004